MKDRPLATVIKSARFERHLSQGELATQIKTSQSEISRWENGKQVPPQFLPALWEALELPEDDQLAYWLANSVDEVEIAFVNADLEGQARKTLLTLYGYLSGRNSEEIAAAYRKVRGETETEKFLREMEERKVLSRYEIAEGDKKRR